MKLNQGKPTFGILVGILFMGTGLLWMTLGFGRTLLLLLLFVIGYFIGGVNNKTQFIKDTVNRVIPEKKDTPIDIRETVTREQEKAFAPEKRKEEE